MRGVLRFSERVPLFTIIFLHFFIIVILCKVTERMQSEKRTIFLSFCLVYIIFLPFLRTHPRDPRASIRRIYELTRETVVHVSRTCAPAASCYIERREILPFLASRWTVSKHLHILSAPQDEYRMLGRVHPLTVSAVQIIHKHFDLQAYM